MIIPAVNTSNTIELCVLLYLLNELPKWSVTATGHICMGKCAHRKNDNRQLDKPSFKRYVTLQGGRG